MSTWSGSDTRLSMRRRLGAEFGTSVRRLRRTPTYAAAAVANLALGIGAVTGIYAVLEAVVLRPLPYPDPDRLVLVQHEMPGIPMAGVPTLFGGFQGQVLDYRERSRLVAEIAAYTLYDAALGDAASGDPEGVESVRAGRVTAGFLRALGLPATRGRLFGDDDPAPTGMPPALVSHTRAGSNADDGVAIGRVLRVDGTASLLLGVVGSQGPFPVETIAVWTLRSEPEIRVTPQLLVDGMVVRLAAGVAPEALAREFDAIIESLPDRFEDDFVRRAVEEGRLRARVTPLAEVVVGPVRRSLWLLTAAGALILLAALANVIGLLLPRCEAGRREMAVRRALGARTLDLLIQHLAESMVVAGSALLAAVAFARAGLGALARWGPSDLPRVGELTLGWPAGSLAVVLAAVAAAALVATRALFPSRPAQTLRGSGTGVLGDHSRARLRTTLAAGEMAVAVVLLVGAGLIVRSFVATHRVDPGFDAEGVVTFRVPFPAAEIDAAGGFAGATALYQQFAERLGGLAGVNSVGYASCAPFARTCGMAGLTLVPEDPLPGPPPEQRLFGILQVSPGYHHTLGIPLLSGRLLEARDHQERTNAVVVSAAVAEALWPGASALGRTIATPDLPTWAPMTVVGVVGEARHTSLAAAAEPVVYLPVITRDQVFELAAVTFVVDATTARPALIESARALLAELRSDVPIADPTTLAADLSRSTSRLRFAIGLLATAALVTLVLGATGIYGVMAHAVSLRRDEFGIRLALGAGPRHLRRIVARQAAVVSLAGVVVGLGTAAAAGRVVESLLYGVAPTDPTTYLAVAALLAGTAALASYLPARRAAATDPMDVLRCE